MANPDDLTFSLLPSEDPIISPEENLRLAANESLDMGVAAAATTPDAGTVIGRGWAFDFGIGQFHKHGQSPAAVGGEDQIKVWIEKTLYTARFAHEIYSDNYGAEGLNDIIGMANAPASYDGLALAITDALKVHDHIQDVSGFSFRPSGETLEVSFDVTLTNGATIEVPVALTGGA